MNPIDNVSSNQLNRSILILQLAVNLMESSDLNDEDAALYNELMEHSVIKATLKNRPRDTVSYKATNVPQYGDIDGAFSY